MNRKAWIAHPWLLGWLLLVLVAPCAVLAETPSAAENPPTAEPAQPQDSAHGQAMQPSMDGTPHGPEMSPQAKLLGGLDELEEPEGGWFIPDAKYPGAYDAQEQLDIYGAKHLNKTARPPIQLGRRLYDRGAYEPRPTWLGAKNPLAFHFMAYGDVRVAGAYNDNGVAAANGKTDQSTIAVRLNLDLDLAFTATERIHAFVRPLDKNGSFTRYDISGGIEDEFTDEFDFALDTLFFEGDLGAITQGFTGRTNSIDLPVAIGRIPMLTQNGIWLEDTFDGFAIGITAKNSPKFDISNYDLTFFAGFNEVDTAAVPGNKKSNMYGIAAFADIFGGYVEAGYGYVDAEDGDLSYHNVSASFTKRYMGRVANSVRIIGNFGQQGIAGQKTADGVLLLIENSFIPRYLPWGNVLNLVPYANFFVGFDSPQSLARSADSGGVLRNTGITFESDGLTGYPTLDARAQDSYGGAFGIEYLFKLDRQIVVEASIVERMSSNLEGSEYALGVRYQHPITNAWIVRFDAMHGWRERKDDIFGVRLEIRRKL